jgi:hypothetical protein
MSLCQEIIAAQGSHYELGFETGRRLAGSIAANLEIFWDSVEALGLSRQELIACSHDDETRLPPNLYEEIRGLAEGSGQGFRELLAYNLYRAGLACDC